MIKSKVYTIVTFILVILMVIVSACILVGRYFAPDNSNIEIMILTCNAFECALFAVLFIQNRLSKMSLTKSGDISISGSDVGRYFGAILLVMCIKVFTDQVAYATAGHPSLSWISWTTISLTYACSIPLMIFFWNFCGNQLQISKKEFKTINYFVIGLGAAMFIVYIINLFTGILFTIDENGRFSLSPTYWIMTLQNLFSCIVCLIAILKAHILLYKKIIMAVMFIVPLLGVVLGILTNDLNFLHYLFMTIAIFFCYVSVYIRGEDEYKAKLRELDMATQIQRGALRDDFGDFGDHKIYAYMNPAKEVGGDFYDFFDVDPDTVGVLIADVSGKGIPAAMFMMQGLSAIRELARQGYPINEVIEHANDLLCEHNENEYFITAWMAYINKKTGKVICVNAGHNAPILKHSEGAAEYIKSKPGMVLAALEGVPYHVYEFELGVGDTIFMYTDGITEAHNINKELYGEERLLELARSSVPDPEELTTAILNGVNSFVGKAEQFDDMTIICYERKC